MYGLGAVGGEAGGRFRRTVPDWVVPLTLVTRSTPTGREPPDGEGEDRLDQAAQLRDAEFGGPLLEVGDLGERLLPARTAG